MAGRKKRSKELEPDEKAAVLRMVNPQSDTYGSLTGSIHAIRPALSYSGAAARGQRVKAYKQEAIRRTAEQWLAVCGAGADVRAGQLADVLTGNYRAKTVMRHKTADGSETETTIERSPSAADVVRAVDVASKVAGDYARQRVAADVLSVELKALARRFAPTARGQAQDSEAGEPQAQALESESEGVHESRQVQAGAGEQGQAATGAEPGPGGAGLDSNEAPAASFRAPMMEEAPVALGKPGEAPVEDEWVDIV